MAVGPQPPKNMTALELLQKAVENGVDLVQIADNLPLEKLPRQELEEVKTKLTQSQQTLPPSAESSKKFHP